MARLYLRMHNLITIYFYLSLLCHTLPVNCSCLYSCSLLFALCYCPSCGSTPEAIKGEEAEKQVETNLQLMEQVGSTHGRAK
jgi:hypothetical protein